jgi:hypothetical protein
MAAALAPMPDRDLNGHDPLRRLVAERAAPPADRALTTVEDGHKGRDYRQRHRYPVVAPGYVFGAVAPACHRARRISLIFSASEGTWGRTSTAIFVRDTGRVSRPSAAHRHLGIHLPASWPPSRPDVKRPACNRRSALTDLPA